MWDTLENVVFAGGGVRGLAYVGALQELRDRKGIDFGGGTPKLKSVLGVSIGSLFALMIACSYTVAEITEVASCMKQSDVMSADPVRLFSGEISLDDASKLKLQVEAILHRKNIPLNITMKELFEKTQVSFQTVVTDLTAANVVHITHASHPELSVVTAMVATMTLPLVYPPVLSPNGHLWIDGGVMENFPMTRFHPSTLLGFDFKISAECNVDTLINYISRVMYVAQVPMEVASWKLMSAQHQDRCIMIDTGSISTLRNLSDLTQELRDVLLKSGKDAVKQKIEQCTKSSADTLAYFEKCGMPTCMKALETCVPPPTSYIQ